MSDTVLQEQQLAPDFTLPAIGDSDIVKDGQVSLSALRGKVVALYFYPKDDTPGCTAQACSIRDANTTLLERGIVVLGVSADTVESHQKFAEKFQLSFPLLADTEKTVVEQYGVWKEKNMYGKKYLGISRETFLIDREGVIRKIWHKVKPESQAADVLAAVEELKL